MRESTLEKRPERRPVLRRLGGILSVAERRKLNYAVEGEHKQPRDVARMFLLQKGLVR